MAEEARQPPPKDFDSRITLRPMLRCVGAVLVLDVASLMLGSAFFIMLHGLYCAFTFLLMRLRWSAAVRILSVVSGVPVDKVPPWPSEQGGQRKTWSRALSFLVWAAFVAFFFYIGIEILVEEGFSGQNLFLG